LGTDYSGAMEPGNLGPASGSRASSMVVCWRLPPRPATTWESCRRRSKT